MNTIKLTKLAIIIFGILGTIECTHSEPANFKTSPIDTVIEKFSNNLIFHAGFENSADASLAIGKAETKSHKGVSYSKGKNGMALSEGTVSYFAENNFNTKAGSIAVWLQLDRLAKMSEKEGYYWPVRVLASDKENKETGMLMLGKMNAKNQAKIYAYQNKSVNGKNKGTTVGSGDSRKWKKAEWHLLVIAWKPGALGLSLDGAPLKLSSKAPGLPKDPSLIIIAASKDKVNKLNASVDEVMILDRPLDNEEINWLWKKLNTN